MSSRAYFADLIKFKSDIGNEKKHQNAFLLIKYVYYWAVLDKEVKQTVHISNI